MSDTTKIEWTDATLKFGAMTPPALMCSSKPMRFAIGFDPFYAEKDAFIDYFFAMMALAPQHRFLVLTKNSRRMREYHSGAAGRIADAIIAERGRHGDHAGGIPLPHVRPGAQWWPLPNVWLGVSIEDQITADERIPDLLATPAAVRWVSAEPLLGPIDFTWIAEPDDTKDGVIDALLGCNWIDGGGRGVIYRPMRPGHEGREMTRYMCSSDEEILANRKLDWIIAGGESGRFPRPMHPDWLRTIRDQCAAANIPFFFKQWGNKAAGRMLDGVTHDAYPEART